LDHLLKLYGKKLVKREDGGFVLIDISENNFKILKADGIEYE